MPRGDKKFPIKAQLSSGQGDLPNMILNPPSSVSLCLTVFKSGIPLPESNQAVWSLQLGAMYGVGTLVVRIPYARSPTEELATVVVCSRRQKSCVGSTLYCRLLMIGR